MKKIIWACLAILIMSCGKDIGSEECSIAGSWLITEVCRLDNDGQAFDCTTVTKTDCNGIPLEDADYLFGSDGSFRHDIPPCGGACSEFEEGTWMINGNSLIVNRTHRFDCSTNELVTTTGSLGSGMISDCSENQIVLIDALMDFQTTLLRK